MTGLAQPLSRCRMCGGTFETQDDGFYLLMYLLWMACIWLSTCRRVGIAPTLGCDSQQAISKT